jgi:hypothetical protein
VNTLVKLWAILHKGAGAAAIRALSIEDGILVAVGVATHCIEKVQQYKKIGVEQLLCLMQNYGVPHKTMQSFRLWGEQIIPHCK